jgi:hypothetical protein
LAAFPAVDMQFGIRRAGSLETAQTYAGEFVSGNYFAMFGVSAYAGRTFSGADDHAGAAPVAVMSYRLWQERYRSDPSVIGSTFNVDEKPFTWSESPCRVSSATLYAALHPISFCP